jgi:hypothetical protein
MLHLPMTIFGTVRRLAYLNATSPTAAARANKITENDVARTLSLHPTSGRAYQVGVK